MSAMADRSNLGFNTPEHFKGMFRDWFFQSDYEIKCDKSQTSAKFIGIQMGTLDVCRNTGFGIHRSTRGVHHIRNDKVDNYMVHLPLRGRSSISQNGFRAKVAPDQFVILKTTTPLFGEITAGGGADLFISDQVCVPGSELRSRVPRIDDFCDQTLQIGSGSSVLMRSLIGLVLDNKNNLLEPQLRQLGAVLMDSLTNSILCAPEFSRLSRAPRQSHKEKTVEKAKEYIWSHLSDAELSAGEIAGHCCVSLRSLQNAFALSSTTPIGYLHEQRLQHCRRELMNPKLHDRSITAIANTWGFNSLVYFSQSYKKRFGVAPTVDRRRALSL